MVESEQLTSPTLAHVITDSPRWHILDRKSNEGVGVKTNKI